MGSGLHFTEMELINYDWNPVCSYEIQWTLVVYSVARSFCYAFFNFSICRDCIYVAHNISFIVVLHFYWTLLSQYIYIYVCSRLTTIKIVPKREESKQRLIL